MEILAETATAVQLIRSGRTVGTQFHPEVNHAHVANWLHGAPQEYLDEHGVDFEALLVEVAANEERNIAQCGALVDWYLDEVAFPEQMSGTTVSRDGGHEDE